jgi:hypothetical protein
MAECRCNQAKGLRLRAQGFEHGAWGMEHREKPQILDCPSDSHPPGGFPVSQFEIKLLAPDSLWFALCLAPWALRLPP